MSGFNFGDDNSRSQPVLHTNARKTGTRQTKQLGRSLPRNQQVEWTMFEIIGLTFIVGVVTFCFIWGFLDILNTVVTKGLLK
jgi:hypothetical protein